MEESRQRRFNDPGNSKSLNTVVKVFPDSRALMGTVARLLSEPEVSTYPLLYQCCQQRTGKTDNQAQKEEGVDPDGRCGRGEWWRFGKDGSMRYVRVEEPLDVIEMERRGILGVGLKVEDCDGK
jgi:hypothetical protein